MAWPLLPGREGVVVDAGFRRFPICIPSRKREAVVAGHPMLPLANVFVHESEMESYARYFRDHGCEVGALLPHRQMGLTNIRNDMMERCFGEEDDWLSMFDDDVIGLFYIATRWPRSFYDAATVLAVLTSTGNAAVEMGAGLFGYHQSGRPQERDMLHPFTLRGWTSAGAWGVVDPELRFDPKIRTHDDMDLCIQCVAKHGYLLRDERFWAKTKVVRHGMSVGGLAGIRSSENEQKEVAYLRQKWGSHVVSEGQQRGVGITVTISIPR